VINYLKNILPGKGQYCVAMLLPGSGKFRHFFYDDIEQAQTQVSLLDSAGHTVYIAQATFDKQLIAQAHAHNKTIPFGDKSRKAIRGQANAAYLKNFFLDIDCGEKWPLKSQVEGAQELKKFLAETGLQVPTVINSGNGLYAQWVLAKEIPASQWRTIATVLKKVVAEYSPKLGGDASRTSDSASVLRVPGTTNRKNASSPKKSTILKLSEPVAVLDFVSKLGAAARRKKISRESITAPTSTKDINADFMDGLNQFPKYDPDRVADYCNQLNILRESKGDVVEPLWYACLGVLVHCDRSTEVIHQWSCGHPDYNQHETDRKAQQWLDRDVGPSTCANLGVINPSGCIGCANNGKIKSPIVLGRTEPEKIEPEEQEYCDPPQGYRRGKDGLYIEVDGRWIRFYDCDLYVSQIAYDESLGYEVATIKHFLPHEGDMEFVIRSSLVNSPKELISTLSDNHVKVIGVTNKKYMTYYLEGHMAKVLRHRRMTLLFNQMGWKLSRSKKHMFVLGKKIFHEDGLVDQASLAKNVPTAARGFRTSGDLTKWAESTRILDEPGMEPYAFALMAGGFGAPLMKFTGFDGAIVSLVGASGAGKTLMLRWALSVWGKHDELLMLRDDTRNSLVARLGVYGNLPLMVDEVTNIPGLDLSDLVYRITQGRDKVRLTKSSEEKKNVNKWNTLALTSSNSSLIDKLSGIKHDAGAEINRIFEYSAPHMPRFSGPVTTEIYWMLDENYGLAGEEYIKWLTQHHASAKPSIDRIRDAIEIKASIKGEERFWGAIVATAIYGGAIAKSLGLIKFDVNRVMNWAIDMLVAMRGTKLESINDPVAILGQFIDDHINSRLLVKMDSGRSVVLEEPRGSLVMRQENGTDRLYISRAAFNAWIARQFGNYTETKNSLQNLGILLNANKRKVLGAGTDFRGAQQPCWEIDLRSQHLDTSTKQLVEISSKIHAGEVK